MVAKLRSVNLSKRAVKGIPFDSPSLASAIKEAIKELSSNPLLGIALKGQLKGLRRYRVGSYRIVYYFTDDSVEIVNIDDRKDVYR